MDKSSGFSIIVVSLLASFLVALLAINKTVTGYMLSDVVLLSALLAGVSVVISAALWKKSTLPGGDGHANRVAATTAIAAAFYGMVAMYGLATVADDSFVEFSQLAAFLIGTGFLAHAFREAVVLPLLADA